MKKLLFALSLPNETSYQREQTVAARETAQRLGAEVQIVNADNDALTQSQQVTDMVQSRSERRPDAIVLEPLTTTGLVRVGEAAVAAGIGWVVLNSEVDYLERLRASSQAPVFAVTRDDKEIGRIQGRQFAALLPEGGLVLYIQGPATSSAALQRTAGMESTKPANIQIKQLRCSWEEASAHDAVSSWLRLSTSRSASLDLIGCQYDGMAMGARKAFEEQAERTHWQGLPFTGVDGLKEGRGWVDRGMLAATVVAPTSTNIALELLVRAFQSGVQPALRTTTEMTSYPSLDKLTPQAKRAASK